MDNIANTKLTSGELCHVWEQYMNNCAAAVVLEHFQKTVEDTEVKGVCSYALETAEGQKTKYKKLLNQENYPIPSAFSSKEDLNSNAPKMLTDGFVLFYLHNMSKVDLPITAICLMDSVREDIRQLYNERMDRAQGLFEQSTSLLLKKGLFVRPPLITSTHESKPIAEGGFLSNFFGLGTERPLTAREANELHKNVLMNYLGKSFLLALTQANTNINLQKLLMRGEELASKIIEEFSKVLIENDLPVSMTWDTGVLDSKVPPFSDRLICFLIDDMNKIGLANYGYGAAFSSRKDLKSQYIRIIADVYQYEEAVKTFMIENQWLEQPPLALDRIALVKN
jgi:hypothetical protein